MTRPRFWVIIAAIGFGISSFACSQGSSPESTPSAESRDRRAAGQRSDQVRPHRQWWRDESITAQLRLTDDQIQAINDLMTVSTGDSSQQRQQERQLTLRYLRALSQEPYDSVLVDRVSERLVEVMSSEDRRRIENIRDLREILNRDQWTKLWELAPRVFQIGRFRALRGPTISVTDSDVSPTPTP